MTTTTLARKQGKNKKKLPNTQTATLAEERDTGIHKEMELLRGQHLLEIPPYLDYRNMGLNTQACFINIRSLNKHAADLANHFNFQNRYLTITAETNMQPRTDIEAIGKAHKYRAHTYRVETIMPPAKHDISVFAKDLSTAYQYKALKLWNQFQYPPHTQ